MNKKKSNLGYSVYGNKLKLKCIQRKKALKIQFKISNLVLYT